MSDNLQVPTIDSRERIPPAVIAEMTRLIVERFKPQRIILFGSYAHGNPAPESDVDLLVIMNSGIAEMQQALEIRRVLNPLFGLDLVVHTPENLRRRIELGNRFLRKIIKDGQVLYESVDA